MTRTATKLPAVKWEGIVKVQRSLFTSSNQPKRPRVLITNQDQTVRWEGPADKDILRWFEPNEVKFYAKAKLRGTVIHIIRKHYEPRTW